MCFCPYLTWPIGSIWLSRPRSLDFQTLYKLRVLRHVQLLVSTHLFSQSALISSLRILFYIYVPGEIPSTSMSLNIKCNLMPNVYSKTDFLLELHFHHSHPSPSHSPILFLFYIFYPSHAWASSLTWLYRHSTSDRSPSPVYSVSWSLTFVHLFFYTHPHPTPALLFLSIADYSVQKPLGESREGRCHQHVGAAGRCSGPRVGAGVGWHSRELPARKGTKPDWTLTCWIRNQRYK